MNEGSRNRIFASTRPYRTVLQTDEIKTSEKTTAAHHDQLSLIRDGQSTSIIPPFGGDSEMFDPSPVGISDADTTNTSVNDTQNADGNISGNLSSTSEVVRHDKNERKDLDSQITDGDNSMNNERIKTKSKKINDEKAVQGRTFNNNNERCSNLREDERKSKKAFETVHSAVSKLCNPNTTSRGKGNMLKMSTNFANSDFFRPYPETAKRKQRSINPKHSTNVTVEKSPHQNDPRLTVTRTQFTETVCLDTLHWQSAKKTLNTCDREVVTLSGKSSTSVTVEGSETSGSLGRPSNQPHSVHKKSHQLDSKRDMLGVSDSPMIDNNKPIECNISLNKITKSENEIGKYGCTKNIAINPNSIDISKFNKKSKVINDEEVVCRYNRSAIENFCKNSFPTFDFCCHVYIRKGECVPFKRKNDDANISRFIDHIKSVLAQGTISSNSGSKIEEDSCQNKQNVININNNNCAQSEPEAYFDKTKQDEEMQILEEIVEESSRTCTQVITKDCPDNTVFVESKVVPTNLFMEIYKRKIIKVSEDTESVVKINHTTPVNSSCEVSKKEIKSSQRIKKQLYDPIFDSKVGEDKLRTIFGDDLADLNVNGNPLGKIGSSTISNFPGQRALKRKYSMSHISSTREDACVKPNKIAGRRQTIHFSSSSENSETSKDNSPAVFPSANLIRKTGELNSKKTERTNVTTNIKKVKQFEKADSDAKTNYDRNHDQEMVPSRTNMVSRSISEINIIPSSHTNENEHLVSEYTEKKVEETTDTETRANITEEAENLCDTSITNIGSDTSTQMKDKSNSDENKLTLNVVITDAPLDDNEVKKEILSVSELLISTEQQQNQQTTAIDCGRSTMRFATSIKKEDEEVNYMCDSPSVEPAFATLSEMPEYFVKAEFNPVTCYVSVQEKVNSVQKHVAPLSSQQITKANTQERDERSNLNFYSTEIGKKYFSFYNKVHYILKGYIPLQRAYNDSYRIIYETIRSFPHSHLNFLREDLSQSLIMHDRRKSHGWLLLMAVLELPKLLTQFNFTDFLRITAGLLNKNRIIISITVLVQHLLELMLVYDHEYKRNRATNAFMKNLVSFAESCSTKKSSLQRESDMTHIQYCLLKTQILTYLQLSHNQMLILKNGRHFTMSWFPTQNVNTNMNVGGPRMSNGGTFQTLQSCVQHGTSINETQQSLIQNKNQTDITSRNNQNQNIEIVGNISTLKPSIEHGIPSSRQPLSSRQYSENCNGNTVMDQPISRNYANLVYLNEGTSIDINSEFTNSSPNKTVRYKMNENKITKLSPSSSVKNTSEIHSQQKAMSSGATCVMNNAMDARKKSPLTPANCSTNSADTRIIASQEMVVVPECYVPRCSITSDARKLENGSSSTCLKVGSPQGNQSQTNPSAPVVLIQKTQSSGSFSVGSNSDDQLSNHETSTESQSAFDKENSSITNVSNPNIVYIIRKSSNVTKEQQTLAISSVNSNTTCSTSTAADIKQEENVETENYCEDEVIDLTWIDDFTKKKLVKNDNHDEFMSIKIEPLVLTSEAPSSPGDSGVDIPKKQCDLDTFGTSLSSVRVEEEDYPEFFSYDFD